MFITDESNFNSTDTVCKSAIFLNNSNSAFETNESSIQTTESYIVSSESSDKQVDSERNDISTNRHPSNTSISFLEQGNRKTGKIDITHMLWKQLFLHFNSIIQTWTLDLIAIAFGKSVTFPYDLNS